MVQWSTDRHVALHPQNEIELPSESNKNKNKNAIGSDSNSDMFSLEFDPQG